LATKRTPEEEWRKTLVEGNHSLRGMQRVMRRLPSAPRCKMCQNPFSGFGGRVMGWAGFRPSRKNPNLCARCCENLPPGGIEMDVAVLFADVRGSTSIGEHLAPTAFAERMNRFYKVATDVLVRHDAIVDKLIGDEVMALFLPGIAGSDYRRRAVETARALLAAVGYGSPTGPWLDVGAAVNAGMAYVGNVGQAVVDFTALGDPVNVAARMQASAEAGEVLVSDDTYPAIGTDFGSAERRVLDLRGHERLVTALVLTAS
jgi:adenylate cyclase